MRDEPQDLVQDLVTEMLVKLRKHPAKVKDRNYCHKVLDWVWLNILGNQVDPVTRKILKRGKQNKLAYRNVQPEHELDPKDRRYLSIQTQGNCHEDPS